MDYGKFIDKLNEIQKDGVLDVEIKYDIMDMAQELSVESFERGMKVGMDIYKG